MPWRNLMNADWWNHIIPFALTVGQKQPHMNIQRIAEALIIAMVSGGITMYGVTQRMDERINNLAASTARIEVAVEKNREDQDRRDDQHRVREDQIQQQLVDHMAASRRPK